MNDIIKFFRTALPVVIGAVVLWFVLAGIFALSLFVILPLVLIFAAMGAFYYWRFKGMLTSASVGEIGVAMQSIDVKKEGSVQFNRQMGSGAARYQAPVFIKCYSRTPIEAGEEVCVENVEAKEIFVKRMGV